MRTFQFYFVSTPIGNLDDLSIRAVDILGSVDIVLAEDTRRTRVLLKHHGIDASIRSFHDHNKERVTPSVISALRKGRRIALVADAGTPTISDPGYYLARRLIEEGVSITALPGASAVMQALVLSGLPPDRFTFFGYMPRKDGARRRILSEVFENPGTSIFFESPHRLLKTLTALDAMLGEREVVVARELTKLHEEIVRGKPVELLDYYRKVGVKGEVTLLVRGPGKKGKCGTP